MGTAQDTFAGDRTIALPEVTSVTCPVPKYVLRMCNRKWLNIRLSGLLTGCESRDPDQKYVLRMPGFFLSNSNMATRWSHPPSGFPWVCAWTTGSCATPVVTEAHVIPLEVSLGCSLRRPRPMTIGNPTSYI